jgi:flavin-dependent dehydrogenase
MVERLASDVLIVGAGPAGTTAALVLARAGVRVTLLDRARFPRHKLCGDTLNPGTLAILARLGVCPAVTRGALSLEGMLLTGPNGVSVEARYPHGTTAAAMMRREFDHRMLGAALAAGADFEERVSVSEPLLGAWRESRVVTGVVARMANGAARDLPARVTIAADGRDSRLASALGLSWLPAAPRRWAIGAYFGGVEGLAALGEMHVRRDHYIGVAPVPGGLANAILVLPLAAARQAKERLPDLLQDTLRRDPLLAPRFAGARRVAPPTILGPMAREARHPGCPGLVLAGDAAGFIDPMTGDGMRFAIAGGELAARAALEALEHGWNGVAERLARARRQAFSRKWRFNRGVRRLTGSPSAVACVAACAPFAGPLLRRAIAFAGDTSLS